tara:strand:+ start:752 stop:2257 length:1506 start_codon:yes stop_codon:yes gene_type:complete
MTNKKYIFIIYFLFVKVTVSQESILSNKYSLPKNILILSTEKYRNKLFYNDIGSFNKKKNKNWNIELNFSSILNNGHSNVDNNAEFYSTGPNSNFFSTRLNYSNSWLYIELEPFLITRIGSFTSDLPKDSYYYLNNHSKSSNYTDTGFKHSQAIIHYNGIGIGYGIINNWWSSGSHSAIALSSNSPSQKTYSIGTFKPFEFGKISLFSKFIVKPYKNEKGEDIYLSGIKSFLLFNSRPVITVGFHRTYLSGNLKDYFKKINYNGKWSLLDASKLVFEPIFAKSKTNLDYTYTNVPGADKWDQILTGYINLVFQDEMLEINLELSSDDSRANFTDLRAHWDHSVGYIIGIKKFFQVSNNNLLMFNIEYLSTKLSNTFNPSFWRGNGYETNYYYKEDFDYFTFDGRRMGAHSGSSSDDLIFVVGLSDKNSFKLLSFNKERHGVKSMVYPELKNEYIFTYSRKIKSSHSAYITFEYETINNFGFIKDNFSVSKLIWLGYTFSFN